MYTLSKDNWNTKNMVKTAILGVIGMVLMFFKFSTWFAPSFLKLDLSDLPGLIGAFAMGPMVGVMVQLVKNILKFFIQGSSTGGIGEISNFLVGSAFVYVAGLIYYRKKTFINAIIGMSVGTLAMTVFAGLSNYFIVFPIYAKLMPLNEIINMVSAINKFVYDYKTLILYAVVPFNILKGIIVSAIALLIYKNVSPILRG